VTRIGPARYLEWWRSGDLAQVAGRCSSVPELARALGVSPDALTSALRRLRLQGESVPALADLLAPARLVVDQWDEPTQPYVAPGMELTGEHEDPVEEHRLRRDLADARKRNKVLLERVVSLEDQLEILAGAREMRIDPIVPRERGDGPKHEATAVFLVSDLHLEEEVRPERVNNLNRFNLEIARLRMRRLAERQRWFLDRQREDFTIRDVVLWLGGDMFTGHLHPDNIESTLLPPPAAFAFAKQLIGDCIRVILEDDRIERLIVPCNDGNHSRLTKDLRASTRVDHSLETLMYGMLADDFRGDPRVQFEIAQGDRLYTEIYGHTVRWTHGAEVRGGAGIGGIMIPLYRAMARWETERRASITCVGHFHQRISLSDLEMNGSLIGDSPYARRIGARFQEPTQSAFIVDARRGKGVSAPLWVSSPEEEIALYDSNRRAA
jgi:hypothetical protein